MKVEHLTFNRYATELHLDSLLTEKDVSRAQRSLEAKGDGFIHDLTSLAGDIRLALSRKYFRLSEHTNRVFERFHASVLPRFLGGALRKVFTDDGSLRDEPCLTTCAALLMFADSLKRTDPAAHRRPTLEAKLWSGLEERFGDAQQSAQRLAERLKESPDLSDFLQKTKLRFRSTLSKADLSRLEFGTGPGKNLDRYEACLSTDWFVDKFQSYGPASQPVVRFVRNQLNRQPFKKRRSIASGRVYLTKGYRLRKSGDRMKCSAQPKSNKALRGVGVMDAFRMACQISLQRVYYRDCLDANQPLNDQDAMKENLRENWVNVGTIDLSTASDLLYWYFLYYLGNGVPWFDAAFELRTKVLELPTGSILCAAPVMGEAITFPLLSLALHAIALSVCDEMGGGHEFVRIYGDDIQTKWYYETIRRLEQIGFRVSHEKSYPPDSHFKESCEAHYVEWRGRLRACRPVFIPTAKLNRRGRLNHKDAYRLLVLAKEAYLRNPYLSEAACQVVESRTSLRLPDVLYHTPHLGRPTMSRVSHGAIELVTESDHDLELSQRGALRKQLRSIGTESESALKLSKKRMYLMTIRTLKKLRVRDTLLELENLILKRVGMMYLPEEIRVLEQRELSDQDIRSWVQQHLTEDEICDGLAKIRSIILGELE